MGEDARSVAQKVFAIADAFGAGDDLTLTEIAKRAGLPLSTAHRLVGEWVRWGGLVKQPDGTYRLGMKMWRLGVRQPTARRLKAAARPYLEDLRELTREHVHLAVLDGAGVVYLERMSALGAVSVISDVGTRLPLHATGVGLTLLAYAPPALLDEVLAQRPRRYQPNTLTTKAQLRAALAEIRATGLAVQEEALTVGAVSFAAPVRDAGGEVVAAVSVVAHVERRDEPALPAGVRTAARAISAALGYR